MVAAGTLDTDTSKPKILNQSCSKIYGEDGGEGGVDCRARARPSPLSIKLIFDERENYILYYY